MGFLMARMVSGSVRGFEHDFDGVWNMNLKTNDCGINPPILFDREFTVVWKNFNQIEKILNSQKVTLDWTLKNAEQIRTPNRWFLVIKKTSLSDLSLWMYPPSEYPFFGAKNLTIDKSLRIWWHSEYSPPLFLAFENKGGGNIQSRSDVISEYESDAR